MTLRNTDALSATDLLMEQGSRPSDTTTKNINPARRIIARSEQGLMHEGAPPSRSNGHQGRLKENERGSKGSTLPGRGESRSSSAEQSGRFTSARSVPCGAGGDRTLVQTTVKRAPYMLSLFIDFRPVPGERHPSAGLGPVSRRPSGPPGRPAFHDDTPGPARRKAGLTEGHSFTLLLFT